MSAMPALRDSKRIHHIDGQRAPLILSKCDIALDKDGVFTRDHGLLDHCRRTAFEKFGERFTETEKVKSGFIYTIDKEIGSRLGAVKGYNTGAPPVEAIIAVNRFVMGENPEINGVQLKRGVPREAFEFILAHKNAANILDELRASCLTNKDRELAQEMYEWYHEKIYKNPDNARFMEGVPDSAMAFMEIFEVLRNRGNRLSVLTDTPNREIFWSHMRPAGFTESQIGILKPSLVVITQEEVQHRKPHHEGLAMLKRPGIDLVYFGDTVRDGKAVDNAKEHGISGVEFMAVLSGGSNIEQLQLHRPIAIIPDLASAKDLIRA